MKKSEMTPGWKIHFDGELMSPSEWRDKYIHENDLVNATPFGLYDGSVMKKYAQYYHKSRLQAIAGEVEERLKSYDITDYMDKAQVYDALDASNPQEVGEIKQLVWFYHLITKHLDQ